MNISNMSPLLFSVLVVVAIVMIIMGPFFNFAKIKRTVESKAPKGEKEKLIKIPFNGDLIPLKYGLSLIENKLYENMITPYLLKWISGDIVSIERINDKLVIRFKREVKGDDHGESQLFKMLLKKANDKNELSINDFSTYNSEFKQNLDALDKRIMVESKEYFHINKLIDENGDLTVSGELEIKELNSFFSNLEKITNNEIGYKLKYDPKYWDSYLILNSVNETISLAEKFISLNRSYKYDTKLKGEEVDLVEVLKFINEFSTALKN